MNKTIRIFYVMIFMIAFAVSTANAYTPMPGTLGTDYPCEYIEDDPENDIFCHTTGKVAEDEKQYFLINVNLDKRLNISGSAVAEGDKISVTSLINPLGAKEDCTGDMRGNNICTIIHPTKGIWLVEVTGKDVPQDGGFSIGSNYDIYRPEKYTKDTGILKDNIKFYRTYIETGSRQEHLCTSASWEDAFANMELTIISPDVQTKSIKSEGDADNVRTYFPNPGATAEGTWIAQLHALDTRADLNFSSNYEFEYIESQEIIDGIVEEKEIKEYPILIEDSGTPLALTAIREQAGDILKIYSIYDPKGNARSSKTYTDGCAIKDPEPGIWLVNVQGQSVVGQAPFRLASTHSTYIPDDHKATEDIDDRGSVFYYTDIYTENKTHLVTVASWDSYEPNMELTIISTNLKSAYDQSESDEKVAQKAYLTPGDTAEGRWIVQVKSIWKDATVTTNSNYNLTRVPTQSQIHGDLKQGETKVYYLEVTDPNTPLVITLTSFQSGDEFQITKITKPDEKNGACTKVQSGKETYTCAVQDPATGVWVIEVKGKTVIGEGPFNLASTFELTSCGNGVCDADENCDICAKDCACNGTKTCHREQCLDPPKTVGEKKTWINEEYEDGLIAEENYEKSIAQLSGYEDTMLLSEIGTATPSDSDDTDNDQPGTSSGTLEMIIIIILALIPPAYLAYRKSKGNLTGSSSYSTMNLDFESMTFIEKARLIITKPKDFFGIMPTTGGYKEPFIFLLKTELAGFVFVSLLLIATLKYIINLFSNLSGLGVYEMSESMIASMKAAALISSIIVTIAGTIGAIIVFLITCILLFISFKIVGGKKDFESIFRTTAYINALWLGNIIILALAILFGIVNIILMTIPMIILSLYTIYTIYAYIVSYKKTQELSTIKTIIAFLVYIIIFAILETIVNKIFGI